MNLLVLPGMFPRHPGDIHGIFVYDYLDSVKAYCNIKVVAGQFRGERKLKVEQRNEIAIYRYSIASAKTPSVFTPMLFVIWLIKGLYFLQRFQQIDIVHTHRVTIDGVLSYFFARMRKIPFVVTVHSGPFATLLRSYFTRKLTKWVLERTDAVLTVSDDLKQQILETGISPRRIYVTYNPVDTVLFKLPEGRKVESQKNIIFVGRLESYKGGLRVMRAFQQIHHRHPDWTLTIVGDGPEQSAIENVLQHDPTLLAKVKLWGQLDKPAIATEMHLASFFVFPSEHETFGLVIAEAMAAGLPVIVGNQTAPKEFVDAECGILVPPTDVDAIAEAMHDMIEHLHEYDAERIREKIVRRFGLDIFGEGMQKIYREVIDKEFDNNRMAAKFNTIYQKVLACAA